MRETGHGTRDAGARRENENSGPDNDRKHRETIDRTWGRFREQAETTGVDSRRCWLSGRDRRLRWPWLAGVPTAV